MRGMIPAQAPFEGGEPTRRKGSYSEESVGKNTIGMVSCNDVLKLRAAEEKRPQIKGHRDEPVADDHCFTLVVEEHGAVARHTCRRVLVGAMRVVFESASAGTDLLAHRCALT